MPFDADLLSDDISCAAEAVLPKLITDNGDLRFCPAAEIYIFGNEQAAEKRARAKFRISVSGSGKYAALRKNAVHFDVGQAAGAGAYRLALMFP